MLSYNHISHAFDTPQGRKPTLTDLSLHIEDEETICLVGPSGCGKTTALRLANRMLTPTQGEILFDGEPTDNLEPLKLRRRMGYVPQKGQLLPHLTVFQNIELLPRLEGWTASARRERARELLQLVNLTPDTFGERYPRTLSGGQQQRVAIARALALDPSCLLMDEPFSALDSVTKHEIQSEFAQVRHLMKKTILLVTHDLEEAFLLGDRVALMHGGRILQCGVLEDFRDRPVDDFTRSFMHRHFS